MGRLKLKKMRKFWDKQDSKLEAIGINPVDHFPVKEDLKRGQIKKGMLKAAINRFNIKRDNINTRGREFYADQFARGQKASLSNRQQVAQQEAQRRWQENAINQRNKFDQMRAKLAQSRAESSAWDGFNTLEKANNNERAESSAWDGFNRMEDEVNQERIHNQEQAQENFEKSIQGHNEKLMEAPIDEELDERAAEAQAHSGYVPPAENTIQTTTSVQRLKKNGGMFAVQLIGLGIIWFIGRTFLDQIGFGTTLFFGALLVILFIIELVHIAFPEGGRNMSSVRGAAGKVGSGAGKLWGKGREKLGPLKEKGSSGWNRVKDGASSALRREPEGGWKEPIKSEDWKKKENWTRTG